MRKNNLVEGTMIATGSIILVKILGMLYVIPFYKIVGNTGGALYSYAYNIYAIFLAISSAGLPNAVSKVISEYNALDYKVAKNRTYQIAKKIISMISIISFIILFVFAEEIGRFIIHDLKGGNTPEDVAFAIRCVSPAILIIPFLSITKGYLQGHKYVTPSSIAEVIEQLLRIIVILLGSYLCLNVFKQSISITIGVAVSGAFFGGLAAYLYLRHIIRKHREELDFNENKTNRCEVKSKEITKKIITYAVPFVIISLVTHIYFFTDQVLVLRTLNSLGYSAKDVEFVASSISTWAAKICTIVSAIGSGMAISLIPTIVASHTKNDKAEVSKNINKALSLVITLSVPITLGISILSTSIWTLFYDTNPFGGMILKYTIFSALLANVYLVVMNILQSLNRFKLVYIFSFTGFLLNALLDIPLMRIFNYIGIEAFLGSILASVIGYSTSIAIGLISLKKIDNIKYKDTVKLIVKTILPVVVMTVVLLGINYFIPLSEFSKIGAVVYCAVDAIVGGIIYLVIAYKLGILENVFGKAFINRILKKLTLGKLHLN